MIILSGEGIIPGRTIARTRGTEAIWPGANVRLEVTPHYNLTIHVLHEHVTCLFLSFELMNGMVD